MDRMNLLKCVEAVSPAISSTGLIDYQYITICGDKILATNGSIRIDAYLKDPLPGLYCAVHGEQFLTFLKGLSTDSISMDFDGSVLVVSSGRSKMKFLTGKPQTMIQADLGESKNAHVISEDLQRITYGLYLCGNNVATDRLAGPIGGVGINGSYITSTNRVRAIRFQIPDTKIKCIIPRKFTDELRNGIFDELIFNDSCAIAIRKSEEPKVVIQSKLILGNFPNLDEFFSVNLKKRVTLKFGEEINSVVKRHSSVIKSVDFSNRESRFSVCGKTCTVTTSNSSIGEVVDTMELEEDPGVELSFLVDPSLLVSNMIKKWEFSYMVDGKYLLFDLDDSCKYLIQTRE